MGNNFVKLYDTLRQGFEAVKTYVAEGLAAIIPGCKDAEWCSDAVKKAVDYGAAYLTGLPPDLPSSDQLIADSIANEFVTLAEQGVASATGADAEILNQVCKQAVDCKEKISAEIEVRVSQARSFASQAACNSYEAYFHGQAPTCLDPSIVVHPAPGAINSPAVAMVRVTRNNTPAPETGSVVNDLAVEVNATSAATPATEVNPFLKAAQVPIPALAPGESIVVPVKLESMGREDMVAGGVAHIKAVELCYSPGSTWDWVLCANGGSDQAEVQLP